MKLRRHYIAMWTAFSPYNPGTALETTIEELSTIIDCTARNMVLLLKRMQEAQWLIWTPKKGRGNRSSLQLLVHGEQLALQEAQEMVEKQNLRGALQYIQAFDTVNKSVNTGQSATLSEQFQTWLSGRFGLLSVMQGQQRTDMLRFPLTQIIHSLDPASIHYSGEGHLVTQLYDGLVRMDERGTTVLPHLAHTWDTNEARTEWTFYLRKGVLFHHGRELLASDVKYTIERLKRLAPSGLFSWVYTAIKQIETLDDRTVRISLSEHNEMFLAFLTTNRASIVPKDLCEQAGYQLATSPVGTGPFRLVGHEGGVWLLDAFAPYFQGRAFLDRVEVWTVPGMKQRVKTVPSNDPTPSFQIMHNVRINDMAAEQWQQVRQSGMTCKFLTVNESKQGPLSHLVLRELLSEALDHSLLTQLLTGDVIAGGNSFWPELAQLHASKAFPSPAAVRDKLAAAGYQGESLLLATIPQYEADAAIIQQLCARSGIELQIRLIPAEQFKGSDRMSADLLLFAIMLDEHKELRLIDLYKSMQQHMLPTMRQKLEDSIHSLLSVSDAKLRANLFLEIEQQLQMRHSLLFLYHKHLKTAFHPSIRGISLASLSWVRFRDIWFTP